MSNRLVTCAVAAASLVGLLVALPGCESPAVEGKQVGNKCPEIAGQDADGNVVRLSELRGKVVLVNFWAPWCGPCREMIPHEREMVTRKYKGRPFVILGIAQDPAEEVREFQKGTPMPWPNIIDGTRVIGKQWSVDSIPAAILVDHNGIIRERWRNGLNPTDVWDAVERAVKKAESP
ncbi:MAG TPA: TlpA disulfide reductase family protein [Gemmataceae bacterium]|nr:TlpA disulfide reductase family protein [Gemmataceae bacterium]